MKKLALNTISLENASESASAVLAEVKKNLGFIPNLFGSLANNTEALKAYLALSESFSKSGLSPVEQQVVAITVSRENQCHYCVAAQSAISAMSKLDAEVIHGLREGKALKDRKLEALRLFTKRVVASRGWVDESDVENFCAAGFTDSAIAAVILGVTMKTLSNYVNHVAATDVDPQFSAFKV